jgi:hypothetical protein
MTIQEQADAILARPDADELTMRLAQDREALLKACKRMVRVVTRKNCGNETLLDATVDICNAIAQAEAQ